jgi:DNA-binding transcriptional ArsR family regulator
VNSLEGQVGPERVSRRVAEQIADTMFALSTPSRVEILICLLERPHDVSELIDALEMEQSAISHQLRVLREHSLVKAERDGRRRVYALAGEHVEALVRDGLRHVERSAARSRSPMHLRRSGG